MAAVDECGIRPIPREAHHDGAPGARASRSMQGTEFLDPGVQIPKDGLGALGIVGHHGPAHPKLVTFQSRLITFNLWPPGLRQKPDELARSGFFYEGRSDQVRCFSCDGGLSSWEEEDSPAKEHAKWFPGCTFLNLTRGSQSTRSSDVMGTGPKQVTHKEETVIKIELTERTESQEEDNDRKLRDQIQEMKDERSCKICLDHEACVVFLPCGHLSSCTSCAPALTSCPVCRAKLQGLVRVYN